jgi:ribokinase
VSCFVIVSFACLYNFYWKMVYMSNKGNPMNFVTVGGLRIDYLITHEGESRLRQPGGNGLYAAVGAAVWGEPVSLWARKGENYQSGWLDEIARAGIGVSGLVTVPGEQDHRTFFAYGPDGRRDDRNPAAHFARIGQPLPSDLSDYVDSTPGQDDPDCFEPLSLRPADWPDAFVGVTAVHLAPSALRSHLTLPPFLREKGIRQITLDPGERYMQPAFAGYIREMLPRVTAFLPSEMEIISLFGDDADMGEAAAALLEWGAALVVIKLGADGVLVAGNGRYQHLKPYHAANDPRIVDVTGAGDAFCGGFMVGLARTGDPIEAARMGLVSASLVIEGYGAFYALNGSRGTAVPRLAELRGRQSDKVTG